MGIPASRSARREPDAAYGLCKAMIRDDGPGILFTPVKLMKDAKVPCDVGTCMPLNKAARLRRGPAAVATATVTVLTYSTASARPSTPSRTSTPAATTSTSSSCAPQAHRHGHDRRRSRRRTLCILDQSAPRARVGASISARVSEELYDELDAPVKRLCMDDAPVPYASSMEAPLSRAARTCTRGQARRRLRSRAVREQ
ncbi:pyruvate dehydrogenase [Aureococcus anophagefferens]|nr:pyruvate dehydrogenase [Aureococcus anophagefferens]